MDVLTISFAKTMALAATVFGLSYALTALVSFFMSFFDNE